MSTATEIKLLTLLNVSAIKRPRDLDVPGGHRSPVVSRAPSQSVAVSPSGGAEDDSAQPPSEKRRRRSVVFGGEMGPSGSTYKDGKNGTAKGSEKNGKGKGKVTVESSEEVSDEASKAVLEELDQFEQDLEDDDDEGAEASNSQVDTDMFNVHFGAEPPLLSTTNVEAASSGQWTTTRSTLKGFGRAIELQPSSQASASSVAKTRIVPSLVASLHASSSLPPLTSTALGHLGTYKDFYVHSLDGEADGTETKVVGDEREAMRKAVAVHAVNHVLKTRRKIIRNNERLAHAAEQAGAGLTVDPPRDQSFTRPKVLILLPVRSLALHYLSTHIFPLAPAGTQIENLRPFTSSFSLPAEAGPDPLASSSATASFPIDHIAKFRGNSDDSFRIGIKITRKAWRVVMMPANEAKLLECDILVASPIGFKMAAEREDSTDLLSSIEICVADGIDVMQMQNWDHVKFLFNHLNEIPKSPHGCDFSRVKPWYLDSQAKYIRQTILMSRYDSPETRSVFHNQCFNLQGKVRLDRSDYDGVLGRVKFGVRQTFERIDMEGAAGSSSAITSDAAMHEVDQRLDWFTKKTVPALLRSAVSRQNTLIIVPSYFDFVRVTNYFRKNDKVSFAAVSEYSSNSEISKARTMFFKGKKAFLIVTERFHFYRRYQLRGAKTLVFYALPEHAQFYAELLATPFIPSRNKRSSMEDDEEEDEVEVDEAEVTSRVLFSRFDLLRLERIVGSVDARKMIAGGEARYDFI